MSSKYSTGREYSVKEKSNSALPPWDDGVDVVFPIPSFQVQLKNLDILYKTNIGRLRMERRRQRVRELRIQKITWW